MDIKNYIASGVLELYVLDQLSPSERREVEDIAIQYPEIKLELDQIEESLFALAAATAKTPRVGLKEEIISEVLNSESKVTTQDRSGNGWKNGLIALSLIGLGLAAYFGWLLHQEKNKIENLAQEIILVKDSCALKDELILRQERMLEDVFREEAQIIQMKGTDSQPEAKANIVYNISNETIFLETNNLPNAPRDKQYQLWGIVDGTPVDLGVFNITDGVELLAMKFANDVQAFAVTLEPEGGSVSPSMEQMWVIGNVAS